MSKEFQIEPMTEGHLPGALAALNEAHGGSFDEEWFIWKHRRNPAGPSPGWVAVDRDGVIGLRLFLTWRFRRGGSLVPALRPCDTVTTVRARGRGVFQDLTTHALTQVAGDADLIFNTPNSQSLPGYLKMGFTPWTHVEQYLGVVPWSRAQLETGSAALGAAIDRPGLVTDADSSFLKWRYEMIPQPSYESAWLRNSATKTGVIYRIRTWRGLRLAIIAEAWGQGRDLRQLLGSVALRERAQLVRVTREHADSLPLQRRAQPTTVTHKLLGDTSPMDEPILSLGDIEDVL